MESELNSRDGISVYGYIRQNFEQKCLIQEIITIIIQFFKNKSGFLYVCGSGNYGKLGISEFFNKECKEPRLVESVNEILDIAAFGEHTMLVDYKGRVLAFGEGYSDTPQQIPLKQRAISVCVGAAHSLILADSGAVLSSGENSRGQLGHGDTKSQLVPKVIEALREHKITQISAGSLHSGALSEKGDLSMWGYNAYGQCGVGKDKGRIYTPTMIKLNEKVSMIESGYYHSLLITVNSSLYSFGGGSNYCLGHDTYKDKYVPTLVETLKDVKIVNVAGGEQHTLCVDDEFNVWAFGENHYGQCGHLNSNKIWTPKQIKYFNTNKINAKYVAAGEYSSCVIAQNNECFVFGSNIQYQIGLKKIKNYFVPTKLPLFVQKVSMGKTYSTFISNY